MSTPPFGPDEANLHDFLAAKKPRRAKKPHTPTETITPVDWQRADPDELAKFDPTTKVCTMNCGPCRSDPRSDAERKFLCDECLVKEAHNEAGK